MLYVMNRSCYQLPIILVFLMKKKPPVVLTISLNLKPQSPGLLYHRKLTRKNPNTIHIMTMHKAKGLEFDHVILPGLAHEPKSNDKPLLQWHERLNEHGESRLFIATISASGIDDGDLYNLLRHEQQHKTSLENTRLLYIAATRAKKSLYLVCYCAIKCQKEKRNHRKTVYLRESGVN